MNSTHNQQEEPTFFYHIEGTTTDGKKYHTITHADDVRAVVTELNEPVGGVVFQDPDKTDAFIAIRNIDLVSIRFWKTDEKPTDAA